MVVKWTPEKDRIILKGIFKFCDIKSSTKLLQYLADEIGEECTPKAVSHRLTNLKNLGSASGHSTGSANATPNNTPKKPHTPQSRKQSVKRGHKTKNDDEDADYLKDNPKNDDGKDFSSPLSARGKRSMSSTPKRYVIELSSDEEEIDTPTKKKVKTDPIDDDVLDPSFYSAGSDVEDDDVEEEI